MLYTKEILRNKGLCLFTLVSENEPDKLWILTCFLMALMAFMRSRWNYQRKSLTRDSMIVSSIQRLSCPLFLKVSSCSWTKYEIVSISPKRFLFFPDLMGEEMFHQTLSQVSVKLFYYITRETKQDYIVFRSIVNSLSFDIFL